MQDTIRNFRANLAEPWELISGLSPYLESAKAESSLDRTVYLQYGAIEMEPAFPATNLGLKSVRDVFDTVERYPGLKGVMGNNELMLLQLPRTFYFFETAWHLPSKTRTEPDVLARSRRPPVSGSRAARSRGRTEQLRADDRRRPSARRPMRLTAIIDTPGCRPARRARPLPLPGSHSRCSAC